MKKITLYISLIFLNACQPVQSIAAQQQNFVCKALIEGYLKAQQFNNFELRKEKREELHSTDQITYLYWQATLSGRMLGIPKPAELTFQCQRISSQHYRIQSLDASAKVTPLFTIHLPESPLIPRPHISISDIQ